MAHTVKYVRSTARLSRLLGTATIVAAVVGALLAAPLGAAAEYSADESDATAAEPSSEMSTSVNGSSAEARDNATDDDDSESESNVDEPSSEMNIIVNGSSAAVRDNARDNDEATAESQDGTDQFPQEDANTGSDEDDVPEGAENVEGADDGSESGDEQNGDTEPGAVPPESDDATEDGDDIEIGDDSGDTVTIDIEEILSFVADGQTISDYAELYGITEEDVVTALLGEIEARLSEAVEAGALTQAEATRLIAMAAEHLNALVGTEPDGDDGSDDGAAPPFRFDAQLSLDVVAGLTGTEVTEVEAALASGMTLSEFAAQYGVLEENLVAALVPDFEAQVSDALTAGELTEAQAEELLAGAVQEVTGLVSGEDDSADDGTDTGDFNDDAFGALDTIAELTGTTLDDVMAAVMEGRTLVDFAAEHGVSETDLVAAISADVEAQIAANVESGHMTQEQADQILMNLEEIVTSVVNTADLGETIDDFKDCAPLPPMDGATGTDQTLAPEEVCPAG